MVGTSLRAWLVVVALCLSSGAVAGDRRMTLADLGSVVDISDVSLSPDGRQIILVTSRADYVDNRSVRSLLLLDMATGVQRELAPTRPGIGSPKWSPTGDRIAWLDAAEGEASQIHVMSLADSVVSVVSNVAEGIHAFGWSPDGRAFAFLSRKTIPARTGAERHNKSFEVRDNDYLANGATAADYLGLLSIDSGQVRQLSTGPQSVKRFVWLPDGQSLVLLTAPGLHSAGFLDGSLEMVDLRTGSQRVIAAASDMRAAPLHTLYTVSPDGTRIVVGRARGAEPDFRANGIASMPVAGGGFRPLTAAIDRSFREWEFAWLPDGNRFMATAADGTREAAWVFSPHEAARRIDLGALTSLLFVSASRTGALAFVGMAPQRAAEVYYMASATAKPRQLTRFNEHLAGLDLGRIDTVRWQRDGFEQDGVLIYPPGFRKGKKYPLVLHIHGGPMSSSDESFSAFDQWLAAQGWLVFSPNYRGSRSVGDAFQRAIINDAAEGPGRDVMAGVEAVKALGIVDEERIAISGWSYGGYLTAWLTAHHHIWRAAVAAAPVTDWFDSYSLSDVNTSFGYGLGGSPWLDGNAANYWRQSPMAHAQRIRTPTLILSNTGDSRVPVSQSYKLYRALKDNNVTVQFIAYPLAGHSPADPVHRRDWYRRWLGWISEHFAATGDRSE